MNFRFFILHIIGFISTTVFFPENGKFNWPGDPHYLNECTDVRSETELYWLYFNLI